jgi:phosphopantothenoylcysteine decarboxylase/phosphopantothenate--cysteine ligase
MRASEPRILLGVTGSIAAYKAVEIARALGRRGARVQVAMTRGAARFVTPLTFEAITGAPVLDDPWARGGGEIEHVERAHAIELLLVAPASAHTLARLALGLADDVVTAVALSTEAPIVVAPAMENGMWLHPATQAHLHTLRSRGVTVVGPESGALASGRTGEGRLADPERVAEAAFVRATGGGDLEGVDAVVTAGPTWEPIDPVRVLANRSTGAMGIALAEAGARRGARVRLVLGPTPLRPAAHPRLEVVAVETAREMLAAAEVGLEQRNVIVGAAAVGDFRPSTARPHKLKKDAPGATQLDLVENPDVLATLAQRAAEGATVVGFAAETEDVVENARAKLVRKGCHLVVGNQVGKDRGFGPGETAVLVVAPAGAPAAYGPASKAAVASFLWDRVLHARRGEVE